MIQRYKKRSRRFLIIYIPLSILIAFLVLYAYFSATKTENILIEAKEETNLINLQISTVSHILKDIVNDLWFLSKQHELKALLDGGQNYPTKHLANDYIVFSSGSGAFEQIRYIDEKGMEVVRVNYNDGKPYLVPKDQLQNKESRYYFREASKLNQGEVYISPLDLNIEEGTIEIPYQPMIRFATPVFDSQGIRKGIIILNYFADILLTRIKKLSVNALGEMELLNSDGYWLIAPNPDDEWGFMLETRKEKSFKNSFSEDWQRLSEENTGQFYSSNGFYTFGTIYPLQGRDRFANNIKHDLRKGEQLKAADYHWKIVSRVPPEIFKERSKVILLKFVILYLIILVISALTAWVLTERH